VSHCRQIAQAETLGQITLDVCDDASDSFLTLEALKALAELKRETGRDGPRTECEKDYVQNGDPRLQRAPRSAVPFRAREA